MTLSYNAWGLSDFIDIALSLLSLCTVYGLSNL
jgi:hypothetical protein